MTISQIPDRQAKKSRIPCPNFGESRFPGSSQIPNPVEIFCVFPNPAPYFGQIPDPENTLPDPDKRANRYGAAHYPELEKELAIWVAEKRQAGGAVSTNVICLKAKLIAQKSGLGEKFRATKSWCYRFMERQGFSVRCRTTVAQKLPKDYEDKLVNFQRFIITKRKQHNFELSQIGNADQTPLTFDVVTNSTIAEKGVKSVPIVTTGHDKDRFTVMLACRGDGSKLPPYIVFKRKTLPKKMVFPPGVIVRCQEKGWMNEEMVKDWINTVWSKVGGLSRKQSLLVWDSFRAHLSNPVRRALKTVNTECAVIPGGMTSILQPLDVCLNKPFKDRLRAKWQDWMLSGDHTFTASGRTRKAELNVICGWIKEAWDDISPEMVKKSFLKCSITNALDGTEDDELWGEDDDPFANLDDEADDDDDDVEMLYADNYETQQAGIDAETYEQMFGSSDTEEEFYGF